MNSLAHTHPVFTMRPMARFRFDLERVVWDPAYRRWVKRELNRRAAAEAHDSHRTVRSEAA